MLTIPIFPARRIVQMERYVACSRTADQIIEGAIGPFLVCLSMKTSCNHPFICT